MVPRFTRFTRFTPPEARRTTEGVAAQGHETQQRWAWHHTQRVFGQVHGARRSVAIGGDLAICRLGSVGKTMINNG